VRLVRPPAALSGRLTDTAFLVAWRLVRLLPEPLARSVFETSAGLVARAGSGGVAQLRRNLARVVAADTGPDELDALARAAMRSYGRYWMETFRLPSMDVGATLARTHTEGDAHLDVALAAGKGAILALPHSGNWDVAGLWLVRRGQPFATVAERLQPESLFDRFVAYRQSLGMEVLPLTGGDAPPAEILGERLRAGGVVCLVAERDLSRSGVEVDFFGERTRMPAGPAVLAATTGATLLPVHLYYEGDGWGQWMGAPIPIPTEGRLRDRVAAATQRLADVFADRIAQHPQDWHMLQRLWLADLPDADPRKRTDSHRPTVAG